MPQSYSPVYLPQDWSATSMGANNAVVDVPVDSTTRELTIPACLDPDNAINQGSAASYSQNNLVVSGNSAHATVRTNILTDGSSKYVWEVTVVKHDTNIKIGAMLPDDNVSGSEGLGTNASTGQGWSFVADDASNIFSAYRGTAMVANQGGTLTDGDMFHIEFNNATGDVYVWRKASGGTWSAQNSGNTVVNDDGANNGKTALAGAKVHLAGHLYQTSGTNLMRFNFSGPFDKAASATYVPFTQTATGVGNHWTLNPLASTDTLTNGNLSFTGASNFSSYVTAPALPLTGKWYWEIRAVGSAAISASANYDTYVGVVSTDVAIPTASHTGNANLWVWANQNPGESPGGQKHNNSTATLSATTGFGDNSIIMIAVDMDNSKIYFGNDGTWAGSGNPASGSNPAFSNLSGQVMPFQSLYDDSATYNFGAKPFIHTPPTGFKALSTANLPAPTVKNPDDGFALITLQNGATIEASLATARTGWSSFIDVFKREDTNNEDYDVRFSDDSGNSMHFNTNAAAGSELSLASGVNYSAWSWRVGATYGCYTAEISHTNGATTNQAHGLGSGAKTAVAKRSDSTGDWYVSHPNLSSANIRFNVQEATTTELVTVDGTNVTLNSSFATGTYRVIVWEQIEGFSAFTGYIHNGSTTDGPYINLGGSASLIAWRNIDSSNSNDFFSTFPSYTSTGGNPTDIRYNWGNGEKGYSGITIGDVIANGYKMRPSSGSAFGKDADDPMLVWAWGLRPFGGSGVAQARTRS